MKIALELQPCCGKRSGIGLYTYELAKRLHSDSEISYQGNLFNFMGRNDNSSALCQVQMPIVENRSMPYGIFRRTWNVAPLPYSKLFPAGDITHFFNYIVPPKVDGKVITTIHDMTYVRFPETMDKRNLRRIRKDIDHSIDRSEVILTVSEFSKREIIELLHIPAEQIAVVYNAPSLVADIADFAAVSNQYHIRRPYILYVGTIEPRKNLVRLLKAFERLKKESGIPHQLVLAGGKGWECEGIYKTAAEIHGNQDVIFCGYIPPDVKNALYKNAALFVFPSIYEGFGIPPLEAMTFGVPVVCADAASLPEVVGDSARLVNPSDELDIAEGIYDVLSNPSYAAELSEKGSARVKLFSWESSAQKLQNIYKSMVSTS